MTNQYIAKIFKELAQLLEIKGENPYKIRAYQNAARVIESLPFSIETMVKEGKDLTKLPAIGEQIAKKIIEIVTTGRLQKLEQLKAEFPKGILSLLSIEGLGAKHIRTLYETLHFQTIDELEKLAKEHKIRNIKGFGPKLEEKIANGIRLYKQEGIRFLYSEAEPHAKELHQFLLKAPTIITVVIAGSFRRCKESVGDLDIVAAASQPDKVIDYFTKFIQVAHIVSKGDTRSTVVLNNGLQVDLRVVKESQFGAALHYFTGSKAHVVAIRKMAQEAGFKINEYGLFRGDSIIASENEAEIYNALGMDYIPPQLREDRGEIAVASKRNLPQLLSLESIRGDMHLYSNYSYGSSSIKELATAAMAKGYSYIAICDHFGSLDLEKIEGYLEEIEALNRTFTDFKIFKGVEVDILEDGSLALSDEILRSFDIVYIAVNSSFKLSKDAQTKRLLRALENPYIHAIAHLTSRLLHERPPIELDYLTLFDKILERKVLLEINSQPNRLDISDILTKEAKFKGIKFLINSAAASVEELNYMHYGVCQARRGWLEQEDVLNCLEYNALLTTLP